MCECIRKMVLGEGGGPYELTFPLIRAVILWCQIKAGSLRVGSLHAGDWPFVSLLCVNLRSGILDDQRGTHIEPQHCHLLWFPAGNFRCYLWLYRQD